MTHQVFTGLGIGLVAVTLPVIAELAVLTPAALLPGRKLRSTASKGEVALTVIVPAHNEEVLVSRTVKSLRASSESVRILVIAHNCSDRTAAEATLAGAETLIYNDPEARGKGFALRYGLDQAFAGGADAVLIMDADSTVSENLIGLVRNALGNGADAVQCRYEMTAPATSEGGQARTHLAALALRGFNLIRPRGRERVGLSCGILGSGFAISRSVYQQVPYQALSLVEDLEYHIHLVLAGKRVRFVDGALVLAELPVSSAGEATQRARWEGGRSQAARRWLGPLARQVLRGRIRLLEPLLDLSSLPLAYACALLLMALILPLAWLRIYCGAALLVVACHVLATAWAGGNFGRDMRLLLRVPGYVLWKLLLLPRLIRAASSRAAWVRTERAPAVRRP